jgi:hypothetical protein
VCKNGADPKLVMMDVVIIDVPSIYGMFLSTLGNFYGEGGYLV